MTAPDRRSRARRTGPSWSPAAEDVTIADIDVSANFLVLFERTEGTTRIRLRSWEDGSIWRRSISRRRCRPRGPGANPDYDATAPSATGTRRWSPHRRCSCSTPTTGDRELLKQQEVLGDFDPARYDSIREWAIIPGRDQGSGQHGLAQGPDRPGPGPVPALRLWGL